jgi:hypothetical protein
MSLGPNLDPFRSRQVPEVAGRFRRERDRQERQASLMWLGAMAAMFSDYELRLLDDLGCLSQNDRDLLRQAGRYTPDGSTASCPDAPAPLVPRKPDAPVDPVDGEGSDLD